MGKKEQQEARQGARTLNTQVQSDTAPIISAAGDRNVDTFNASSGAFKGLAAGGFTPAEEGSYLNRATEGADSASEALQNQVKLAAAKTGQGNPQAAIARISRQLGQNKSQALNDAQVSLHTMENANKATGAQGLAGLSGQSAQQQMAALGLKYNTEEEAQAALQKLSMTPGIFDNIMNIGKAGAGAAIGLGVRV